MASASPWTLMTPFAKKHSLQIPLIVAPMAGGPSTPELVAASSQAGALGSLGGATLSPDELEKAIARTRELTDRPFAVNLFTAMPELQISREQMQSAVNATRVYRKELNLPDPVIEPPFHPDFQKQVEVVLRAKPAVFSFVFGKVDTAILRDCRSHGIQTIGTATSIEEGLLLEALGVDAVVAQGFEAGGHRGIFSPTSADPGVRMRDLAQSMAALLKIPVIAAGGIMDGKGIAEALSTGAQAVQMGTAFLLCEEAGTSEPYRKSLRAAQDSEPITKTTRAFSGRLARGIENRFMQEMDLNPKSILPFPAQNALTRDLRAEALKLGRSEFLSLWAGTGVSKIREGFSARTLIERLRLETLQAL